MCQSHFFFVHHYISISHIPAIKGWFYLLSGLSTRSLYCFSFSSLDLWPLRWLGRSYPGTHVILCSRINTIFLSILSKKKKSVALFVFHTGLPHLLCIPPKFSPVKSLSSPSNYNIKPSPKKKKVNRLSKGCSQFSSNNQFMIFFNDYFQINSWWVLTPWVLAESVGDHY